MSLKNNILANFVSQIYVTVIGIIMVPMYLKFMGAEAYALVGFFSMLLAWFNILDMGLTPTMARETARFRGGALDAITFHQLVRALEVIFLVIALLGGFFLLLLSEQISTSWLNVKHLSISEVQRSIQLMSIIISLRWMCGLYRGQISGSERLIWLSGYNTVIATLRFVGVLPVLIAVGSIPTIFFGYQFGVALIELIVLVLMSYRLRPSIPEGERIAWSWTPLRPVLKFSLTIAFTSSVWVIVTQTDKLVLSKILPLAEYGYFTLAVLVASGIMIISGPVSSAIMPRMARMEAEGDHKGVIRIYRQSTQLVAIIAGSAAITVTLYAEPLLLAWTGSEILAHHSAPVLVLYAIGNGILAISAFPYYLQYAKGNLRLHLIGNVCFVIVLIPSIIFVASKYGSVGAGYTWLTINIINLLIWVPFVHHKLEPGLNKLWFGRDILVIVVAVVLTGYTLASSKLHLGNNLWQFSVIIIFAILTMLAGFCSSSILWDRLNYFLVKYIK